MKATQLDVNIFLFRVHISASFEPFLQNSFTIQFIIFVNLFLFQPFSVFHVIIYQVNGYSWSYRIEWSANCLIKLKLSRETAKSIRWTGKEQENVFLLVSTNWKTKQQRIIIFLSFHEETKSRNFSVYHDYHGNRTKKSKSLYFLSYEEKKKLIVCLLFCLIIFSHEIIKLLC